MYKRRRHWPANIPPRPVALYSPLQRPAAMAYRIPFVDVTFELNKKGQ